MKISTSTGIRGSKIDPTIIVGNQYKGYTSGAVLDANAIIELIEKMSVNQEAVQQLQTFIDNLPEGVTLQEFLNQLSQTALGPNTVTSESIVDGAITEDDLSDDLKDTLSSTYQSEDESFHMNGF